METRQSNIPRTPTAPAGAPGGTFGTPPPAGAACDVVTVPARQGLEAVDILRRAAADGVGGAGVKVETFAREGDAADAILDVAEEQHADLIVVGNKGMTGAKRFLLGSVPNKVSHHAPCSVLIIRTT